MPAEKVRSIAEFHAAPHSTAPQVSTTPTGKLNIAFTRNTAASDLGAMIPLTSAKTRMCAKHWKSGSWDRIGGTHPWCPRNLF